MPFNVFKESYEQGPVYFLNQIINQMFLKGLNILSTKSRGYWDIKSLKIKILICRANNFVFSLSNM